ncbi:phytanoyl-CoA dioxygenase family protein [Phenylobacterium sp.]|uniref:phytanoyl-CoA dioxygenase family protein n=1 Tax=Phenylobacterium sp. TaxID=1871053 RepID=UPI003983C1A2
MKTTTAATSKPEPSASPRDHFLAEGFVVVRGLLDPAELDEINRQMGELFVLQLRRLCLAIDLGDSREAWQANAARLLAADPQLYISTARLTQMLPSANRLLLSEPILALVRELGVEVPVVSTRASNHIMSDLLRIPGGYHKSPPHQDWRSMQGSLDSLVLWIPTTPVTERSHALEVVPRSHLLGLLPTVDHIMTPTVSDPRITEDQFVRLPMNPGDVVAFSSFMVHRTGEEGDGLVRIAFSTRYNNAAEETYVAHGYPTPYKYSYQTDLIVEGFPTIQDVSRTFPAAGRAE